MSSWGYIDNVAIKGTVTVSTSANTVTGSSTEFVTNCKQGDYLTIAGNKYQVEQIVSNTSIFITTTAAATNTSGATAYLQQGPKFLSNVNAALSGGRQSNLATIQNVYGVDLTEMQTKQAITTTLTNAGAGYSAAARANTTATISTTGASQPTDNALATVYYSGTTVANIIITSQGAGYTTAAQSNTTITISTTGASQPTTNATATLNYTSSTESSNASHTGWNYYLTYVDALGQVREKNEVLVAMSKNFTSATTGDAADDTQFPDS